MATLQCPLLQTKGELINGRNQTINQITDAKPAELNWAISFKLYMYHKYKYTHFKYKYTHFINKHLHEVHFRKIAGSSRQGYSSQGKITNKYMNK